MTEAEAVEAVVRITGHARIRDLCDTSHPDYSEAYARGVVATAEALAAGAQKPTPPAPRRLPPTPSNPYALGAACPWRDVSACGCRVPRCWAGLGDRDGGRGCSLNGASACVTRYLLKPVPR